MTIWIGRRALLQSGAAMLGGVMMSGISSAQAKDPGAKTSYEFMVKDLVYPKIRDGILDDASTAG